VSDRLVLLNQTTPATEAAIARQLQQLAQSLGSSDARPTPRLPLVPLSDPLFAASGLTSDRRDLWDTPRDLDSLRVQQLGAQPQAIDVASAEIAEKFNDFVQATGKKSRQHVVHVIGREPLLWLIAPVCILIGFLLFLPQCNSAYLVRLQTAPSARVAHYALLPATFAVILYVLFVFVWRSENPELWTAFGDPRWALGIGLGGWLLWVAGPWCFFHAQCRSHTPRAARWWTFGIMGAAGLIGLVVALVFGWWQRASVGPQWRLMLFTAATWLPILMLLLIPRGRYTWKVRGGAACEWWRTPSWSAWIKSVVVLVLVVLMRGAFPASLVKDPGGFAGVASMLTHDSFVVLAATAFALIGAGIAWTQQHWRYRIVLSIVALACLGQLVLVIER